MTIHNDVLKLFNVMVTDNFIDGIDNSNLKYGVVTNFTPTVDQDSVIYETFQPINVRTLFTVEERNTAVLFDLLYKQILHYVEVYGLNSPGLFDLEQDGKTITKLNFIKGITNDELQTLVLDLLYGNKPVKHVEELQNVVNHFNIPFDFDKIQNNEMRIRLYDNSIHAFNDGDDAVRYMVFKTTGESLLIKSKEVIDSMSSHKIPVTFFEKHAYVLSQVFNRHKQLIMAAKNNKTKSVINKISKMSKKTHKPIMESFSKKFVSVALSQGVSIHDANKITMRDKMKIINLLEYKKLQNTTDAFIVRNGKIHVEPNRKINNEEKVQSVIDLLLESLKNDISHLNGSTILLDKNVDYGMPISRKQTVGQLPFGSTVEVDGTISSGVYWKNEWGASDLDLSTIDLRGERVGWGDITGYTHNDIKYSGDMTYAEPWATEFMTSSKASYGLFLNIFNGSSSADYELIVGNQQGKSKDWVDTPIVRERTTLTSRSNVIGFVKGNKYIAFNGRMGSSYISGNPKDKAIISRGLAKMWTVKELLDYCNINYDIESNGSEYDYDLTYSSFSFDKLEKLLKVE